jgi:hypothetical protein
MTELEQKIRDDLSRGRPPLKIAAKRKCSYSYVYLLRKRMSKKGRRKAA